MSENLTAAELDRLLEPMDPEARIVFELRLGLDRGRPRSVDDCARRLAWPRTRVLAALRRGVAVLPPELRLP